MFINNRVKLVYLLSKLQFFKNVCNYILAGYPNTKTNPRSLSKLMGLRELKYHKRIEGCCTLELAE